ncbi:MAG: ABC transporter permease [Acidimicrobiales bacterium]
MISVFVILADGVSANAGRAALEDVIDGYPSAEVLDRTDYKEQVSSAINSLLSFVMILLSLAITIAFLGIANALSLAVHERTRELGLLRAVGVTRRQVRRMVRYESAIVAVLGCLVGLVAGVFFGWSTVQALRDQGSTVSRRAPACW